MLRIIDYKERISHDGRPFMALILQGGIEIMESANGNLYATSRKTSIASTFDEETCKALIGKEIPGKIEKVDCDPYEYTNPTTGEMFVLNHRYDYIPEYPEQKENAKDLLAVMQEC